MTCLRKYIFQLLVSVVFLQMHKLLHQRMSCSLFTNTIVFRVIFKIITVFELFETIISE